MHSRSFFALRAVPSYSRTISRSSRPSFTSHFARKTANGMPPPRRSISSARRLSSRASALLIVKYLLMVVPVRGGLFHRHPPFEDNAKDADPPVLFHVVQNAIVADAH